MDKQQFDPSLNILYKQPNKLNNFFHPQNIAVIGASEKEGSVGRTLLTNLLNKEFKGKIFPVNPNYENILGIKTYKNVGDIKDNVDLAVIAIKAEMVPLAIEQCVAANIPCAIIISAGFKEMGEPGIALEKEILQKAKKGKMRIIGPNCLGVMNPVIGFNATFASDMAIPGNIAFISQSGALCTAVLDWSLQEKIGFSSFISIGSMVDVDWGDIIRYLGNDTNTKSILIYMESIGDARSFIMAAREVALSKPIILIKAGITKESAQAALSHTGALAGSNEVLNAALRRIGVLRVDSIADLFSMAEILSKQPRPKGPNLTIVTNAGGPGVIATDALVTNGGNLTTLSDDTYNKLNEILPPSWSHNNPVDILGDASPDLYAKTMEVLAQDKNSDGILVVLTPQYMTNPTKTAQQLKPYSLVKNKPILASWMGANIVHDGNVILTEEGIPTFPYPDDACMAFAYMWKYSYNLSGLYETPDSIVNEKDSSVDVSISKIKDIIQSVRKDNRNILTEYESKCVFEEIGIPVVKTKTAQNSKEAAELAEVMGYPVVLKLLSKNITHKTEAGGIKLNLNNKEAVMQAFDDIKKSLKRYSPNEIFEGVTVQPMIKLSDGIEAIVGSSTDADFGPVLLFGSGGMLVEVTNDRSLAIPPLTTTLAKRMIEQTNIYKAMLGVRGQKPVDLLALQKLLVNFSNLIAACPEIAESDINPLFVSDSRIIALDARIVLHDIKDVASLPKLAIPPYPLQYIKKTKLKDQSLVTIRPIKPEDETLILEFLTDLSDITLKKQRYLEVFKYDELLKRKRLISFCFDDYDHEITLVVENDEKEILAVGRITKFYDENNATFALIVKDSHQGKGIGSILLQQLLKVAKSEKIEKVMVQILNDNIPMQKMCKDLGFTITNQEGKAYILAEKQL
jgi:acetyltransferase